jgi:hypothetical protein
MKRLLLAAAAAVVLASPASAQLYGTVTTTPSGMNNGYEYFNGTVNGQPFYGMKAPSGMNNGYEYFNGTIGGRPVGGLVVPGNNGSSAYIGN